MWRRHSRAGEGLLEKRNVRRRVGCRPVGGGKVVMKVEGEGWWRLGKVKRVGSGEEG